MPKYGNTLLIPQHTSLQHKLKAMEKVARDEVLNKAAYAGALMIQAQCQLNIRDCAHEIKRRRKHGKSGMSGPGMVTGLIDTGFMVNSVYTASPDQTNRDNAQAAAQAAAEEPDQHFIEGAPSPEQFTAVVTVGAEYFRYQEMGTSKMEEHPTLGPAADQAENQVVKAICHQLGHSITNAIKFATVKHTKGGGA